MQKQSSQKMPLPKIRLSCYFSTIKVSNLVFLLRDMFHCFPYSFLELLQFPHLYQVWKFIVIVRRFKLYALVLQPVITIAFTTHQYKLDQMAIVLNIDESVEFITISVRALLIVSAKVVTWREISSCRFFLSCQSLSLCKSVGSCSSISLVLKGALRTCKLTKYGVLNWMLETDECGFIQQILEQIIRVLEFEYCLKQVKEGYKY